MTADSFSAVLASTWCEVSVHMSYTQIMRTVLLFMFLQLQVEASTVNLSEKCVEMNEKIAS